MWYASIITEELSVDMNDYVFQYQLMLPGISLKSGGPGLPQGHLQSTEYYDTIRIVASIPATVVFTSYDILCTAASFSTKNRHWSITKDSRCLSSTCEYPSTPTSDCALHINHV
jgi:hypothetical protein